MKKFLAMLLAAFSCLLFSCAKQGPIPNGKYAEQLTNVYPLHEGNNRIEYYWEVDGDKARYYASAALTYKCNIIEENGVIYFEGYTWKSVFSSVEQGRAFKYEVRYDEENKSITIVDKYAIIALLQK